MKEVDKIFNSFLKDSIFTNKFILQTHYIPETIHHREKEITQLASIIAPALRMEKISNLFLYGKTGTGKTLSILYLRDQLLNKSKQQNKSLTIEYINCKLKKVADTEYRILSELIRKLGGNVPSTGLPTDSVYTKFIELLESRPQVFIIILDEIDHIVQKISDNFLYNLTRLNSELNKAQISIIGISNDLTFLDNLDPRVKSSLSEEEVVFSPYNAVQLQDILRERSKKAFKSGVISEGVIEKCAAYAAREHGDARRALDLLRISGEIAERDRDKKIVIEHIDKANEKMERDKILDIVETEPKQFQLTLLAIINLIDSKKYDKIFTGEVYEHYQQLCQKISFETLTQRRVGDIIAEFDMLGIINAKVVSKGRYGRMREIKLAVNQNIIEKIKKILYDSLNLN
ncbi:orc1/cdc6 family replication initiation protein [Candidatus Pacearchaeota archaeon]|nr:orc1/cdc6 family replication initiation protein [Candidatus Pacearchaeota archaeon]